MSSTPLLARLPLAMFFVVGLELKREVVTGDLREDPQGMAPPIAAAVGGMAVPAMLSWSRT